jgi:hypothetical protein
MSENYSRSIWVADINGEALELEHMGDVGWNPPDELQNTSVLKGAGGRGAKFDQFDEANVSTFSLNIVQETREEGIFGELAHRGASVAFSFKRKNSDAADDGEIIGIISNRARVTFGGSPTWADNAQVFPYNATCIGYTIQRKNASDIVR